MKSLLKYLKNYRKEAILAPLFKLLEALFELLVPLVIAYIIDVGIVNKDILLIYKMGGLLLLLAVIGVISSITAQYFSAKAGVGFATELRDDLFAHVLTFSNREIEILGKETLITRIMNDINQLQSGMNLFFRLALRAPFIVFGAFLMAFYISPKESLIFFAIILILYIIVYIIMKMTIRMYKAVQMKLDTILGRTEGNLSGVRVIRAFGKEEEEVTDYREATSILYKEQITAGKISSYMNPLTYICVNIGVVLILYTGGIDVSVGNLSQGEVIALVNYMSQILGELLKTANLAILISKALASAARIEEIFKMENSLVYGNDDVKIKIKTLGEQPLLSFRDVSFSYPNASGEALSNISFDIYKNETVGIIGGTGSGKTSLVNLIPRLFDINKGTLKIAGSDIKSYTLASLRESIAMVEQKARLFSGSIRSNLLWGRFEASDTELYKALEIARGREIIEQKEDGLNALVSQEGKNFSGGQKQRLSIARSLLKKADILILDDSSSALDYMTDFKLREGIAKIDNTVIIVSQRVASIRNADKILVLDEGRQVGFGTHKDLLKTCETYREICLSQLSEDELV